MLAHSIARLRNDDEAVSPVIATVLLLAILYAFWHGFCANARGFADNRKGTASMTVSVRSDNGYMSFESQPWTKHLTQVISFNLQE